MTVASLTANPQPLRGARVALLYSPGQVGIDCASGLLRGIERGLLELGGDVRTHNTALYKGAIRGGDKPWPKDSPFVRGMIDFLNEQWPGEKIDICFSLLHDVFLSDELKETLRRRCAKVINYPLNLLDQPHRFQEAMKFCDVTFCSEEAALPSLEAHAPGRIRYVPMASDPWIYRRLNDAPSPRLLFVGSLYANRQQLLDECAQAIPVSIFSKQQTVRDAARGIARELVRNQVVIGPLQAARILGRAVRADRRHVSDEEFVRLAAEHGVSAGFSDVRQERTGALLHKVRLREYEATMCGLCHVARRLPELERGFEEGREILFYERDEEIPALLQRIRNGELNYRTIGRAARARAERDHTWTVRLRAAFAS